LILSRENARAARSTDVVGSIDYLFGDVIDPPYEGTRIVAFVTNDVTPNWGGGVARQIAVRKPHVQVAFRKAANEHAETLALGKAIFIRANDTLYYAALIAQHGLGTKDSPRIHYGALEHALKRLARRAADIGASVHMPRIGTGTAGGSWDVIGEMVEKHVAPLADVRVYDLSAGPRRAPG
jgi:O-acetyl-ADP-ribose deacetylase (regulator of RNase III)